MANSADAAELQRAYDRNLGYARFWLGVGIAILSLLFTFGYNLIFGYSGDTNPQPAAEPALEITALLALLGLVAFAVTSFILASHFRVLYRRDNAALAHYARRNGPDDRQ